jgi:hypothetical protein
MDGDRLKFAKAKVSYRIRLIGRLFCLLSARRLKLRFFSCILLVQVYAEPFAFLLLFMGRSMGSYGQKYGQFCPVLIRTATLMKASISRWQAREFSTLTFANSCNAVDEQYPTR